MSSREILAKDYKNALYSLKTSSVFTTCMKKYGFDDYNICILGETHREQAADILAKQFSAPGGNILTYAFNSTMKKDELIPYVDHAIKTGISLVIVDKNNNVCLTFIQIDIADDYIPTDDEMEHMPSDMIALYQVMNELHAKDVWYQTYIQNNQNKRNGQILLGAMAATRTDLVGTSLFKVFLPIIRALPIAVQSVQFYFAEMGHPVTIYCSDIVTNYFFNNILKRRMNDNAYCFTSSRFNLYQYLQDAFANDELFKNTFKRDDVMNRLNKETELILFVMQYDALRKNYSMEQVFEKLVHFLFQRKSKL